VPPEFHILRVRRVHYATRLWVSTPRQSSLLIRSLPMSTFKAFLNEGMKFKTQVPGETNV